MEAFGSVAEYLESQRKGRPQSFEEIRHRVCKSKFAVSRELGGLVLRKEVNVIRLKFNGRECAFYTVRRDVCIEVVKSGERF